MSIPYLKTCANFPCSVGTNPGSVSLEVLNCPYGFQFLLHYKFSHLLYAPAMLYLPVWYFILTGHLCFQFPSLTLQDPFKCQSLFFFYNTLLFIEEIKTKYNHSYLYFYVNISLLGCKLLSSSILFLVTSGICLLVTQGLLNDILYCFYAELHSASNNLVTFF